MRRAIGRRGPVGRRTSRRLPLEISVDALDIVHGALRISATMVDGAADVSVRLGGDCEHTEVGGGISTLSTLVWALGEKELADAIGCGGLLVRARVHEGTRYVTKHAELDVSVDLQAVGSEPSRGRAEHDGRLTDPGGHRRRLLAGDPQRAPGDERQHPLRRSSPKSPRSPTPRKIRRRAAAPRSSWSHASTSPGPSCGGDRCRSTARRSSRRFRLDTSSCKTTTRST